MQGQKKWVRVAGNATKIKAKHPHGWRCYVEGTPTEIPLRDWSLSGSAGPKNFIPGVNPTGDMNGIVAWIDCFGSYSIEDDVLHIELEEPASPPPSYEAK